MTSRTKLWLGVSLGLTVVSTVVFFVFFYKARLTLIVTPPTAEILINNQSIINGSTTKLVPGTYQITARAPGYLATSQTISLRISDIERRTISLRLVPSVQSLVGSVEFPVLSKDEAHVRYLGKDRSQFFEVATSAKADGSVAVTPLSHDSLHDITNVVWSPDPALVIYQTSDGRTKLFDFTRYDFLHQEEQDLGPDLRNLAWHPTDRQFIAYLATADGERSLVRRTLGSDVLERLADVRSFQFANPTLSWSPNGREVLLVENAAYLFDVNTRQLTKIAGTDGIKAARWSPNSQQLLAQFDTGLAVVDAHGTGNGRRLDVRTPLEKAAWNHDGTAVIVASATDKGQDTFAHINLKTGQKTAYSYRTDQPIGAVNLLLNKVGSELWFTSQGTLSHLLLAEEVLVAGVAGAGNGH